MERKDSAQVSASGKAAERIAGSTAVAESTGPIHRSLGEICELWKSTRAGSQDDIRVFAAAVPQRVCRRGSCARCRSCEGLRATEDRPRRFFHAEHSPGRLGASDSPIWKAGHHDPDRASPLGSITSCLTYSNWEAGTVCYSEASRVFVKDSRTRYGNWAKVPQRHRDHRLSIALATRAIQSSSRSAIRARCAITDWRLKKRSGHGNENRPM